MKQMMRVAAMGIVGLVAGTTGILPVGNGSESSARL